MARARKNKNQGTRSSDVSSVLCPFFDTPEDETPPAFSRSDVSRWWDGYLQRPMVQKAAEVSGREPIHVLACFVGSDLVDCPRLHNLRFALEEDRDVTAGDRKPLRVLRNRRSGMLRLDLLYETGSCAATRTRFDVVGRAFSGFHDAAFKATRIEDPALRFSSARRQTCFLYQWIILNELMPILCIPSIIVRVMEQGAAVYKQLLEKQKAFVDRHIRPVPLEFALGVRRYIELRNAPVHAVQDSLVRSLSVQRDEIINDVLLSDALEVPQAKVLIAKVRMIDRAVNFGVLKDVNGMRNSSLSTDRRADPDCPLLLYLHEEEHLQAKGWRFGPLGSRLAAEAIIGALIHDPMSYWNAEGSGYDGRWCPEDAIALPSGPVTCFADLIDRFTSTE